MNLIEKIERRLGRWIKSQYWDFFLAAILFFMGAIAGDTWSRFVSNDPNKWVSLIIFSCFGLVGLEFWRIREHSLHKWGTAYYLRLLGAEMDDEHISEFKNYVKHENYKGRKVLPGELSSRQPLGFDWVQDVEKMAKGMQDLINHDSIDTGYMVAPNMLFPAAFSLGSQLNFLDEIEFVEMPSYSLKTEADPYKKWARWEYGGVGKILQKLNVEAEPKFDSNGKYELNLPSNLFLAEIEKIAEDGVILITLQNSVSAGGVLDHRSLKIKNRLAIFPKFYCDGRSSSYDSHPCTNKKCSDCYEEAEIVSEEVYRRDLYNTEVVNFGKNGDRQKKIKKIRAADLLDSCLMLLLVAQRLCLYNSADDSTPIVLCARLPKTMAMALGQAINVLKPDRLHKSLWERLIILNWEPSGNPKGVWRIVRVHNAQPPLEEQYETLSQYGYELPVS